MSQICRRCVYFEGGKPCKKQREVKKKTLLENGHYEFLECNSACPYYRRAPFSFFGFCTQIWIWVVNFFQPSSKNILFLDNGGIGTAIRCSFVLRKILELFPEYTIYFVGAEKSRGLFEGKTPLIPGVTFVCAENQEELDQLSGKHWFWAISIEAQEEDLIWWFTNLRSKKKTGFIFDRLFQRLTTAVREDGAEQMLLAQMDDAFRLNLGEERSFCQIITDLVFGVDTYPEAYMRIDLDLSLKAHAEEILENAVPFDRRGLPLIGINLSCASLHDAKEIPLEIIRDIVLSQPDKNFFLVWGPDDYARLEEFYALLGENIPGNLFFLQEVVSLRVLAWIIMLLDGAISAESMFSNMAIAIKDWDGLLIIACGPQPSKEVDPQGKKNVCILDLECECSPCFKGTKSQCPFFKSEKHLQCMRIPLPSFLNPIRKFFHC